MALQATASSAAALATVTNSCSVGFKKRPCGSNLWRMASKARKGAPPFAPPYT